MRFNCDFDSAGCFFRITFAGENCAPWYFCVILNECEVSHVCMQRFLHCVFEMTKQCFPLSCRMYVRHPCWLLVNTLTTVCAMTSNGNFKYWAAWGGTESSRATQGYRRRYVWAQRVAPPRSACDQLRTTRHVRPKNVACDLWAKHVATATYGCPFFSPLFLKKGAIKNAADTKNSRQITPRSLEQTPTYAV